MTLLRVLCVWVCLCVSVSVATNLEQSKDGNQNTARGDPVRTFQRAWKYMIPFLIGVLLKLAAFVPIVLSVLALIAKSAFLSGNVALLMTALNIALKFWYPKWSHVAHPTPYHTEYVPHQHDEFAHHAHESQHYSVPLSSPGQYDPSHKPHRRVTAIEYAREFQQNKSS